MERLHSLKHILFSQKGTIIFPFSRVHKFNPNCKNMFTGEINWYFNWKRRYGVMLRQNKTGISTVFWAIFMVIIVTFSAVNSWPKASNLNGDEDEGWYIACIVEKKAV